MNKSIAIMDPFLLCDRECPAPGNLHKVRCKGGGGDGSSAEYENQLRQQREAREKAEAEAAELKRNQDATTAERKKRGAASFLTGGAGVGDENVITKKSYLGAGN